MFKVAAQQTFTHRIKVRTPVDGGYRDEELTATYRLLSTEEVERFDLKTTKGTTEFLRAAVRRLDDLVDENDAPISFSDELRDRLIGLPHVRHALARAYFEALASDPAAGN